MQNAKVDYHLCKYSVPSPLLASDAQKEGKVSLSRESWIPPYNRKTYYNIFEGSADLAYGQPSQDAPKNICDQPIDG